MIENGNSAGATSAALNDEYFKLLVEKVMDNGTAINETREQIRKLPSPGGLIQGLEQRMEKLETRQEAVAKVMSMMNETLREDKGDEKSLKAAMQNLRNDMLTYIQYFENPTKKEIHYRHFVGWPLLVLFVMGVAMAGMGALLVNVWGRAGKYEASDIKWRYARLSLDSAVTHVLDMAEQQYLSNSEQLEKDVVAEEERRKELAEKILQVNQGIKDIDNLEKQKKAKRRD